MGFDGTSFVGGPRATQPVSVPEDLVSPAASESPGCMPWQTNTHEAAIALILAMKESEPEEVLAMFKEQVGERGTVYHLNHNLLRPEPGLASSLAITLAVGPYHSPERSDLMDWACAASVQGVSVAEQREFFSVLVHKLGDARVGSAGGETLGTFYASSGKHDVRDLLDDAIKQHPLSDDAQKSFLAAKSKGDCDVQNMPPLKFHHTHAARVCG